MNATCDKCGSHKDLETATVIDRDGGAHVEVCGRCRDDIAAYTDLCAVCRLPKEGVHKAESIYFNDTLSENLPIWDGCRDSLIRGVAKCRI